MGCARLLGWRGPRSVWTHSVLKHPLAVGPGFARPSPRPPRELRAERVHTARVLLNPTLRYALNAAGLNPSLNLNLNPSLRLNPSLSLNLNLNLSLRAK